MNRSGASSIRRQGIPTCGGSSDSSKMSNGSATPAFSEWLGTWSAGGVTLPAYVVLVNTDPVYGMISVGGGQCVATWNEAGRISNTERYVNADVTQGSCVDNQWHVTISGNRVSGTDASGANASFSVKRR